MTGRLGAGVVCGIPVAFVLVYFLLRIEPGTLGWLFPESNAKRIVMAILTAFVLFDFYGAGWADGGPASHRMSVVSVCLVGPLAAILGGVLVTRRNEA